jgi:hypothetical protein
LLGITEQTNQQTLSTRGGSKLRVLLACLMVFFFCASTRHFTTHGNQLLPQQTDQESTGEEIHAGKVKEHEVTAASARKALHQVLRPLIAAYENATVTGACERRPTIALRWSAHAYGRRGPPSSYILSS